MPCSCGDPDCWRLIDEDYFTLSPLRGGRRVADDAELELAKRGDRRRIVDVHLPDE